MPVAPPKELKIGSIVEQTLGVPAAHVRVRLALGGDEAEVTPPVDDLLG